MRTLLEYIFEKLSSMTQLYDIIRSNQEAKGFEYTKPVRKKRQLLFYFTDAYTALDIMKQGHIYGNYIENIRQLIPYNVSCGYDKKTAEEYINDLTDETNDCIVIFGADCVRCNNLKNNAVEYLFCDDSDIVIGAFQCIFDDNNKVKSFERIDERRGQYDTFDEMVSSVKHEIYNKAKIEI